MTFEISTLANGLRVATYSMPQVETTTFGMFVDVGARYETASNNGVSHFLEHMAFKGTKKRTALDIAIEFDSIGGHSNAYTSMENTVYYAKVLKNNLPKACEIIADILQNSELSAEEMDRERTVILQEIAMHNDTPDDVVFEHFQEQAFLGQSLGRSILGPPEQVASYNRDDLLQYLGAHYSTSTSIIVASGNLKHTEVVKLSEDYFGGFPAAPQASPELTKCARGEYVGGEFRGAKDLEQMHIVLGFPGLSYTSPDYFTMQVASMILGGGMSSRLFQEVREKRGLAYSISCFTLSYRDCGIFGIYTGTSEDTANEMLEVTAGESIAMLGKLSDSEIERAKVQLKSSILMSLESTSSMFEATGRNILNHGRFRSSDEVIKLIDSVTATDISRVCETIFSGKLSLASLGNVQSLHNYEQISGKFAA